MELKPDYWNFDELTEILHRLADEYPRVLKLTSLGQSRQGRELWCLEVTGRETGEADAKPAMYVDGNTHGSEVTGCAVAVYTAWLCGRGFGSDRYLTNLLSRRAFYIVPRINPDGAEDYLKRPQRHFGGVLTHNMRPYPVDKEGVALFPEDVDGDGLVLQMRQEDPLGEWRASEKDPRALIRRRPGDSGPFYRLYPEGRIRNYSGGLFDVKLGSYILNLNRNYPAHWVPEWQQAMSGPYPLSEPESRAVVEFVQDRPNISVAQSYHTHSGLILRPLATGDDREMDAFDLRLYQDLGRIGEEITGYPCVSTFSGFTPGLHDRTPRHGTFLDWAYQHQGILAFTTELWDPDGQAGVRKSLFQELTEEEELKALEWNDRQLKGRGFETWRPFDHPQLGQVEIGGWKKEFTGRNPPQDYLEDECQRNADHALRLLESTPLTEIRGVETWDLGEGLYQVVVTVANVGYLPTYGCKVGLQSGLAGQISVQLELEPGYEVVGAERGDAREAGHLEGYGSQQAGFFYSPPPKRMAEISFTVRAPGGWDPSGTAIAASPRGGKVRQAF